MTQTMTKEMSQVKPGAMQPMPDLLAVKGVSKQFLGLRAVDNVTLSVKKVRSLASSGLMALVKLLFQLALRSVIAQRG